MVPIPPWWPKFELKKYFSTVDKIITSGQILVFEVSKQLYQSLTHVWIIWPKLELKILPNLSQSIESDIIDRF